MELWEILVPTMFEDTHTPVKTRHHKEWDKHVRQIAGGLTIFKPTTKGEWVHEGELYTDRTIPVRIACDQYTIQRIALITKAHYRQKAVMVYRVSDLVLVI